ncbi:MAG: hypothetical protein R6W68_01400 [Ignavibacteriaceae bacterium]
MKTIIPKLFFVFFIFSASLYAQYFIDEDIIREHRNANKSYMDTSEVYNKKKVFLISLGGQDGMKTNVYVGFDKTEYNKGDEVILTFKRDNDEIFNNYPYNVTLYPGGGRFEKVFILNQGEIKEEIILLTKEYDFHSLNIAIRGNNPLQETIKYGFILEEGSNSDTIEDINDTDILRVVPQQKTKNRLDSIPHKPKPLKLNIKEKK